MIDYSKYVTVVPEGHSVYTTGLSEEIVKLVESDVENLIGYLRKLNPVEDDNFRFNMATLKSSLLTEVIKQLTYALDKANTDAVNAILYSRSEHSSKKEGN